MYFKRVNKKIEDNLKGFDISFNKFRNFKYSITRINVNSNQININL